MLNGAIDMFKPKKIMIKGNKNEAKLVGKYFEIMIRRDRTEWAHPPIVARPRVRVKQPRALSQEVVDAVLAQTHQNQPGMWKAEWKRSNR